MNYSARPTWRNEWPLISLVGIITVFMLLLIMGISMADTQEPGPQLGPASLMPVALIFWLIPLLVLIYRHYSWAYTIQGDHIESRHGIIAREMKTVRMRDLRNINIKQSILQRILGIGDMQFSSSGGSGIEVTFYGVSSPLELQKQLQAAREKSDGPM